MKGAKYVKGNEGGFEHGFEGGDIGAFEEMKRKGIGTVHFYLKGMRRSRHIFSLLSTCY